MALEFGRLGNVRATQPIGMLAQRVGVPIQEGGLVLDPPFQRGAVWTKTQKVRWIQSILADVPLPAIFLNRFPASHPTYSFGEVVIDGQQRIRATHEFMTDQFDVDGETWSGQNDPFRRNFYMSTGLCQVIYSDYEDERDCVLLYLRLLQAGTHHTPAEVKKAQEYLAGLGKPKRTRAKA